MISYKQTFNVIDDKAKRIGSIVIETRRAPIKANNDRALKLAVQIYGDKVSAIECIRTDEKEK